MMWRVWLEAGCIHHTDSPTLLTQVSPYLLDMLSRYRRIEDEDHFEGSVSGHKW